MDADSLDTDNMEKRHGGDARAPFFKFSMFKFARTTALVWV